ncbi:MAG: peptidoglycan editing factor PgeF [Nitratireductor sp.]
MSDISNLVKAISSDLIKSEKLQHGFFTRQGGHSTGIYKGLNVGIGSDDDKQAVLKNRALVAGFFNEGEEKLTTVYQIHSPTAVHVSQEFKGERPKADAIVTNTPNLPIGVLTADCGPVLFADAKNGVIGAAHAGWKGSTGGVLESTIAAMEKLGAKRESIKATLGPTISQANYEVGHDFAQNLISLNSANSNYLIPSIKQNHFMFDLPTYIVDRLTKNEVEANWCGLCTYADEESFFSYRRTTHRSEPDYGRQISVLKLI